VEQVVIAFRHFGGFDFSDLVDSASRGRKTGGSGGFRDIFHGIFRWWAAALRPTKGRNPGTDLEYQFNVPFWTADPRRGDAAEYFAARYLRDLPWAGIARSAGQVSGVQMGRGRSRRPAADEVYVQCPRCTGRGEFNDVVRLATAKALSRNQNRWKCASRRDARWPRIRLPGKGNAGGHGGVAGDLYAIIRTEAHRSFSSRRGRHLSDRAVSAPPRRRWERRLKCRRSTGVRC